MCASRASVTVYFHCLYITNDQASAKKNRTAVVPQKSSLTARPAPITPAKRRSESSTSWQQSKKGRENRMTKGDIGNGRSVGITEEDDEDLY